MKRVVVLGLLMGLLSHAAAYTTGKIAGTVSDAKTGEPLTGVNIQLLDTERGAVTDAEGYFVILNVRPGIYSIRATMIGYTEMVIRNVRVEIDRTTNVTIEMIPTVIKGQKVVIQARRKVIKKDVAGSQRSIGDQEISSLPVSTVEEVVGLQAGVSGYAIRGSGEDQTLFMVDGIELKDDRTNKPITGIPLSAIQQISIQTGGFSAEYSNVRGGLINVVTKEGPKDHYTGTFSWRYSPPAEKHFGISPYDPESFFLRPYLDTAVCWTGTANGAWDKYMRRQYPDFDGWNTVAQSTLADDDPSNDLTPAAARRIFMWQHRKQGRIVDPDYNFDAGIGGPVPFVSSSLGNLRFFLSYRRDQNMYLFPMSRPGLNDQATLLKLTADLDRSTKLTFVGLFGDLKATALSRSGGTDYFQSVYDVASTVNRAGFTMNSRLYTNDYWSQTHLVHSTMSLKVTHMVSSSTYYDILLKRINKRYRTGPGSFRDTTKKYEIFPGYFIDEAPFGYYEEPLSSIDKLIMGGSMSTSRDSSEITTYALQANVASQMNRRHQLKAGFEFTWDHFAMEFGGVNKFLPDGNFWTSVHRKPYRLSMYAQDKLEYQGFIASLGLILDYVNPNGTWWDLEDPYDDAFFSTNYKPENEDQFPKKKIPATLTLSPRLSISHPITENSKLYFNYGHYRQIPTSERTYRMERGYENQVLLIGDPRLPLAKTVSYELGFDQALYGAYLIHLAAYYKDITDQENWVRYISANSAVNYRKLSSNSYEDIRGFEADLTKMMGRWVTGNVNFEYRVNTSGYFGVQTVYENPADQRNYLKINPKQFKPRPVPRAKSVIDFHTPADFGPRLLGRKLLGDWHLNIVSSWTSGSWFTYNPNNLPGVEYNLRWKSTKMVNMKLAKTFYFNRMSLKFFVDVNNVLNIKNFSRMGFFDAHDYDYYMKSLLLPAEKRREMGLQVFPRLKAKDEPGDVRPEGVEFVPLEWISDIQTLRDPQERAIYYDAASDSYLQWNANQGWHEVDPDYLNEVVDQRAYIDMPNLSPFVFLNPRDVFLGINVSFDF